MTPRGTLTSGVTAVALAVGCVVALAAPAAAERGWPDTIGVVRDGVFLLRDGNSAGAVTQRIPYGYARDVPFVGDWDGDGRATPGVVRDGRTVYLQHGGGHLTFGYGLPGDVPFAGDWDGDGIDTVGMWRRGRVYLRHGNGAGSGDTRFEYGLPGDVPLAGDWDGDGVDSVGVYRRGRVYLRHGNGAGSGDTRFDYGLPGDVPVAGHWRDAFRAIPLPASIRAHMTGRSWRPGCPVGLDDLSYLAVRHHDFAGAVRDGRVVVASHAAADVLAVFRSLFDAGFPLARVRLVDDYGGDDAASMAANNTSAFNCRRVSGTSTWSQHSYGTALDLNPVQNPYVRSGSVQPPSGAAYAARSPVRPGMIVRPGPVVDAFARIGWGWGGDWRSAKDYQHFSASGT